MTQISLIGLRLYLNHNLIILTHKTYTLIVRTTFLKNVKNTKRAYMQGRKEYLVYIPKLF